MFTKKLLLSMVATSFVLTGCGGGGGSDDDYNTESKDSLANGTRYYYIQYSTSKITDRLRASYIEVQNKQFKDSKSNKALGYYLLTENKLYTPKDIAQNTIDLDGSSINILNLLNSSYVTIASSSERIFLLLFMHSSWSAWLNKKLHITTLQNISSITFIFSSLVGALIASLKFSNFFPPLYKLSY